MSSALIAAPVIIAAVLITSGVAKLRDTAGVATAFESMDVPPALNRPWIRSAFPYGEIALGVVVLVAGGWLAFLATFAATALMAAYLVLVYRAWRKPDDVDCHCFGKVGASRVTGLTVARNVTLVVLGLASMVDAWAGVPVLLRLGSGDTVGWLVAVAIAAWLTYAIVKEGSPAEQPAADAAAPALGIGPGHASSDEDALSGEIEEDDYLRTPNPRAVLLEPNGEPLTLEGITMQRPALLLWLSFTCGSCQQVLARIPEWVESMPIVDIRIIVTHKASIEEAPEHLRHMVLLDPEWSLGRTVGTGGTPSAVLFGADGMLAGGPVSGPNSVIELVEDMQASLAEAAAMQQAQLTAAE